MLKRLYSALRRRINRIFSMLVSYDLVTGSKIYKTDIICIGSEDAGWVIPNNLLNENSICYCVGVGEDITFDLGLIEKYNCNAFAYDPTPRAKAHVEKVAKDNNKYIYNDIGLWDKDEILKFYAPANINHVSHSVMNLQKTTDYFEARCKRLSGIMKENNHNHIDLLKIDVEGAEYKVLDSIIEDDLEIKIICVEYDEIYNSLDGDYKKRIKQSVNKLENHGYKVVHADGLGNYTFLHAVE